ncbi:MAG: beta-ketoacyl-[acyl-carrier-protein] synthase family protein [Desulfovibrio sp.]|nr:beta-ketoacyl-[acyl-carrier-protein] synthase family protein [Desulfovibrio sp.]
MKDDSLVITGMGAVTPIGIGVPVYWDNLIHGRSGIGPITSFDAHELPVRIAAEVRDFDPEARFDRTLLRGSSLFMQFGLAAAREALEMSGLPVERHAERIGIIFATAMGGVAPVSEAGQQYQLSKHKKVSPHFVPAIISNMGAAQAAILFGILGPSLTVHTACSAGGDAMYTAAMLLRANLCDAVLVMGGESGICDVTVSSLAQAKALSRNNEDPTGASRPFDLKRDGFVIGEGGGAVVLEKASFAAARGAVFYARLAGVANTMDAYHITAPHPEGLGAARCMRLALAEAGIDPSAIGYINAHGTSTVLGDVAETRAVKAVFGDRVPPMSSTKGATGHLMGAGGITEVIACIMSIREGILPPTLNYEYPDPECDLDYIPLKAREAGISTAMSNALGFGGQNSTVVVTK